MAKRAAAAARRRPGFLERLGAGVPERTQEVVAQAVLRVLLVVFILVAGYLLIQEMKAYVMGLERFQVSPATLNFAAVPSWVTPGIEQQLARLPDLPERFSILEPHLAARVAQAYQRNPWVAEVTQVERLFPNRLRVGLLLRQPVAAVRFRGSYCLVDGEGVRLPLTYRSWPQPGFKLPIVTGATTQPPGSGTVWEDEAVQAGCTVAELLRAYGFDRRLRITAVDASNLGSRVRGRHPDIVLHTASGAYIKWGRSPLKWYPGDGSQTVTRKLHYLRYLVEHRIDLRRLEHADVRFDRLMLKDRS